MEQLLHAQGWSHFDTHLGDRLAVVAEPVRGPGPHHERVAWSGHDGSAAEPKPHAAVEHTEAFLLLRMHVTSWNMAAGLQEQIEDQELSAGLCAALANDDPLATDGVVQDTPHATVSVAVRETPDVVTWSPVCRGSVTAFRQPATGV